MVGKPKSVITVFLITFTDLDLNRKNAHAMTLTFSHKKIEFTF